MGSSSSRTVVIPKLKNPEVADFSRQTLFSAAVIEKLFNHFYRFSISQEDDGVIDLNEFCLILHNTPDKSELLEGLFNLFDANQDGVINFREFILGLSIFNKIDSLGNNIEHSPMITAAKLKDQIGYVLRLLTYNSQKKIYFKDFVRLLVSAVKEAGMKISEKTIEDIASNTFDREEYEQDEGGKYLEFNIFMKVIVKKPIVMKWLAVDIERVMQDEKKINQKRGKIGCFN